ncbi:kallikrein-8-like isoform X2 [Saccopteryx bilineata]|uniref:kallikrein-8-like isoform X2 n=1 Tax=Saccopteryx bilineata TaxID=59482 RepID=UPI00338F2B9A
MGRPPAAAMRTWMFLLLLLEACAGHWMAEESKILKGQTCKPHSQPWQSALFQGVQLLCGGVLVDENWVLTAAHCKKPYSSGDNNHDLMLVRLRSPASLGPKVKPINLTDHCPRDGQKCTISGWGTVTSPQENFPDTLNCAEVEIFPRKECEDDYPGKITEGMVCAGDSSGADSCQGDSGGPLVCDGVLQGITSWGSDPCGQPNKPGVYTNLCRYLDWIKKTIGNRS